MEALSRKRKADTYLVGFMGMPVANTGPNQHSCQSMGPEEMGVAMALAPTTESVMRSAGATECVHVRGDWSDARESEDLAQGSERKSRVFLSERDYLP